MDLKAWLDGRSPRYVYERAARLRERYEFSTSQIKKDITECVASILDHGGALTFFTPGSVVERYEPFVRELDTRGVEIATHSYSHIDLRQCSTHEAVAQLTHAASVCEKRGIPTRGFRCPYLSCTDELLTALPRGLFQYSSNRALTWQEPVSRVNGKGAPVFETLKRFYHPVTAQSTYCLPTFFDGMLEIPVTVPDDLQMIDGLHLEPIGVSGQWQDVLNGTHARGDLFTLMFHLELAGDFEHLLTALILEARRKQPHVWVTRLCEMSNWWREKAQFSCEMIEIGTGIRLALHCTPSATVLARGVPCHPTDVPWVDGYMRLERRIVELPAELVPFVGLEGGSPTTASLLRNHGYIVETGALASRCAVRITSEDKRNWASEVELLRLVEASPGPLVKYGRWPNGAKSALCLTGDLDALSILDYMARLVGR